MDQEWVALNELILSGLRNGYHVDAPPKTELELEWLAATITDHVIRSVMLRPPEHAQRRHHRLFRRR